MPEPLQSFEQKLARVEQIVKELEGASVDLARATLLFKEGKALIRDCEKDLKAAEAQIRDVDRAPDERATAAPEEEDELPF